MPSRAHLVLIGHLGADPESRHSESGLPLCTFRVAVDDGRRDAEHTSWYRVTVFGKQAEQIQDRLHKGTLVSCTGRLTTGIWTGAASGEPRVNLELSADSVLLLERSTRDEEPAASASKPRQAPRRQETTDDLEDLPF